MTVFHNDDFTDRMLVTLGPLGWRQENGDLSARGRDWLDVWGEPPLGIALPASTEEVSAIVRICREAGVSITPQGGNTGLNGGSVISAGSRGVILSLARMNRIEAIDPIDFTARVEAGVILGHLHEALEAKNLAFPLHLGSEGSTQIGGLISTNAGGSHAMRFGMTEALILGLEVVLADGSIWDGTRALIKDNSGYQLRRLFCGAEGTLGIVTRAVLRLFPASASSATALLTLDSMEAAVAAGAILRTRTGEFLTALEFFTETGLALLLRHVPDLTRPLETAGPIYLLVELLTSIPDIDLDQRMQAALEYCFELAIVTDGVIAQSSAQRAALWRLREEMPEGQRREGVQIKHDVAAPVGRLDTFLKRANAAVETVMPGVRVNSFGHLADGNVHFNVSPPVGAIDFGDAAKRLSHAIYEAALAEGGTFSAEHGLGQAKIAMADRYRSSVERDLMRKIKLTLDPDGLMNPGKIVS